MKPLTRSLSLSLCSIFVLVLCSARMLPAFQAPNSACTIRVLTPLVPRGGVALFTLDAPGATAVYLRDGTTRVPAQRRPDGRWDTLLGITMDAAVGRHAVIAEAELGERAVTATADVTVTAREFPVQHLRMTRGQDAVYAAPDVQQEYRLIGQALSWESPERDWHAVLPLPVTGRLSTRYGTQRFRNGVKVGAHKGVDIAAPSGTPVYAAAGGTVRLRRDFRLHGRTLVIDHGGGVCGLYLHLRDFGVSEGQRVTAGQCIARVGATGVATGPHLHYALYIHGVAIDPLRWPATPRFP